MSQKIKPTEAELEILQVLWTYGPSNVRFVNDQLKSERNVGYTTTLKVMQIMTEKGMLVRDKKSRTHIYQAVIEEKETKNHLIDKFISTLFGGSTSGMVLQALGNQKCSSKELDEIKKLINNIENPETND
ncbi:BlaI/MecI/CopY family transcriptional regulator [Labilibaculum sp. DW002]|jgi:BlaI family transcriptional regulator, penicillinase repressor|uniref:BlaI/MecI/CopY family transcriptional regulator n=1 Tax=Paralabilibaculum antarcticum TaxID=2912572 RepID=A0ABT5VMB7_9BACT|nr:BlaI/MecI/CopY family transcriptional regulator [Labilibaculum sp. DW002]MDE5416386.1 BlaI/MecI/CopY family transcriptional regulator [Labilibaculum sp. DW002]